MNKILICRREPVTKKIIHNFFCFYASCFYEIKFTIATSAKEYQYLNLETLKHKDSDDDDDDNFPL